MTSQLCLRVLTTVCSLVPSRQYSNIQFLSNLSTNLFLIVTTLRATVLVSNHPSLSKIIKKIVLLLLLAYLNFHDLLCLSQSAFPSPCHSTDTALLKIDKRILLVLDGGVVSVLTLLHLSSAFDTIDLHILIHTPQFLYRISRTVLSWFESLPYW